MDTQEFPQESWFNICILHQNRLAHQQNAKNCIREDYLARFLDLVLWGTLAFKVEGLRTGVFKLVASHRNMVLWAHQAPFPALPGSSCHRFLCPAAWLTPT